MKNDELRCSNKLCSKKNICSKFYISKYNEVYVDLMEKNLKCFKRKKYNITK